MTPQEACWKAVKAKKRLPELEDIILTDSWFSCRYAELLIEGRWIEAEDIILSDIQSSFKYAKSVIRGKLPDKMHNMMILYAIKDPNDYWVKHYFEFIK